MELEENVTSATYSVAEIFLATGYLTMDAAFEWFLELSALVIIIINIIHLLVVSIALKSERGIHNNYRVALIFLGIHDIVVSLGNGTLSHKAIQAYMFRNRALCISSAIIVRGAYSYMSVFMNLLCIDRIISIHHLKDYANHFFVKHFKKIVIGIGLAFLIYYTTFAVIFRDVAFIPKGNGMCKVSTPAAPRIGIITPAFVMLNLLVLIVLYTVVLVLLKKKLYVLSSMGTSSHTRKFKEVSQTISAVVAAHIFCWSIPALIVMVRTAGLVSPATEYINVSVLMLNAYMNFICYAATSPQYRKAFVKFVCRGRLAAVSTVDFTADGTKDKTDTQQQSRLSLQTLSGGLDDSPEDRRELSKAL